jgi:hypothetical protein
MPHLQPHATRATTQSKLISRHLAAAPTLPVGQHVVLPHLIVVWQYKVRHLRGTSLLGEGPVGHGLLVALHGGVLAGAASCLGRLDAFGLTLHSPGQAAGATACDSDAAQAQTSCVLVFAKFAGAQRWAWCA